MSFCYLFIAISFYLNIGCGVGLSVKLGYNEQIFQGKGKTIAGVPSQFYHRSNIIAVISWQ